MKQALRLRVLLMPGIIFSLIFMMVTLGLNTSSAGAHGITTIVKRDTTSASVTVLVLDMSGSMGQNDPQGLRCSAANAFIDLSGPGNYIGVIGLDNKSGDRGGYQNFQQAQVWAQPMEMATLAERQQLQNTIATQSNHCQPDNTTPTYDALNKAYQMLATATNNGQIPGSVVLLTDGVPDPDTIPQMNAIQSSLIPQFKHKGWPIDTIALGVDGPVPGTNTTFHAFLGGVSDATSGKFYDDGHGIVPGVSPLNIADFFVNIFARHNHRIVNNDISPTTLNGGVTRRNFSVTDYTNNLDVVVVKDQSSTTASLITPSGQPIKQSGSGVFVSSSDPHYEIFSINRPQSGLWELDVTGSGQFLMDSLKISGIGLSSISASQIGLIASPTSALALGQPVTVNASLSYNGQLVTDNRFVLSGTITYNGALGHYSQSFTLDDKNSPGTYVALITVPGSAPPGSYEIVINASTGSFEAVVASQNLSIRIERFPVPVLDTTQGAAVKWDPVLQVLYSLPFWPVSQLSQWALNSLPAQPDVDIAGGVQQQQQPYRSATVTALASNAATHTPIPVTVVNDGNGRFHILFPPLSGGTYQLTFKTGGSFEDSHGDFGTTQSNVQVVIVPATLSQELHAWSFTALYLLCLVFLFYLLRWSIMARPRGEWLRYHEGAIIERGDFRRNIRGLWQGFIHRNLLHSRQAKWERGLLLRFQHGGGIEIRADGRENAKWELSDGSDIPRSFRSVSEVRYRPGRVLDDQEAIAPTDANRDRNSRYSDIEESSTYVFTGREAKKQKAVHEEDNEDDAPRYSSKQRRRSTDDESTARRSDRRGSRKRGTSWDDDD